MSMLRRISDQNQKDQQSLTNLEERDGERVLEEIGEGEDDD